MSQPSPIDQTAPLSSPRAAALLGATLAFLDAEVAALPGKLLAWHPALGEWCVLAAVQAYAWPRMGNARRFSAPD